jgi:hypothetical protein
VLQGYFKGYDYIFVLQLSSCCVMGYLFKGCYYVCHTSSKTCDLGCFRGYNYVLLLSCGIIFKDYCFLLFWFLFSCLGFVMFLLNIIFVVVVVIFFIICPLCFFFYMLAIQKFVFCCFLITVRP